MDWPEFIETVKTLGFDYESQPKTTAHECNVCGETEFAPWLDIDRYGFGVKTVVCVKCGLIFANPRMTAEAFHDFYASGMYRRLSDLHHEANEGIAPNRADERAEDLRLMDGLHVIFADSLKAVCGGQAVDLGGDTGTVAGYLRDELDMQVSVIDPAAPGSQSAEDWRPEPASADLVVCLRSVEHLDDPATVMRQVRRALKPGGLFLLSVVRFENLWQDHLADEAAPAALATKMDHPYSFSKPAFLAMLLRAGLKPRSRGAKRAQSDYLLCGPCDPLDVIPQPALVELWLAKLGLYRAALRHYGGRNGHGTQ